jgi:UDP-N-acetylglucosamine 2-epimerase (non-hydrolysing)
MSYEDLKNQIGSIYSLQNLDSDIYMHFMLNEHFMDESTVSIVMTCCNRSKQVYYTLHTIQQSETKAHIVIVDDSDSDPVTVDRLVEFKLCIDFVKIDRDKKFWVNPGVNYNLGFKYVKCDKVIIQNGEVCHVGDICSYVDNNTQDNVYNIYNVMATATFSENEEIYSLSRNSTELLDHVSKIIDNPNLLWFQHHVKRNCGYHFLVSMSNSTFLKIGGFSYDYHSQAAYDDNDFLLKIKSLYISTVCISDRYIMGIHLFHARCMGYPENNEKNRAIFNYKMTEFNKTGKYIEIASSYKVPIVVTILGIRPDFIRMARILDKLDKNFNHIAIHTGQHYDSHLYDVFLKELNIRKPDYMLDTGRAATNHYEQLSYLAKAVPELLKTKNIKPDLILFLGDSNSAAVALPLKKEGYRIGHIEAGMRSYDKRMLEELNRITCDHCSDILFVYHEDYKAQLAAENIKENVFVVGNTVVEPILPYRTELFKTPKQNNTILMDIHRPENFNYRERLEAILRFGNECYTKFGIPVKLLHFKRLKDSLKKWNMDLKNIVLVDLMEYSDYLRCVYNCKFIISDSGTGQEEPALLQTPVIVPRDYTERPQSYLYNCSFKFDCKNYNSLETFRWLETDSKNADTAWLGDGKTSDAVVNHLAAYLQKFP